MRIFPFKRLAAIAVVALLLPTAGCRQKSPAEPEVRNLIFMVGDGMGAAHIAALMTSNDNRPLNLERAASAGFIKTFSANNRVTDSAAAATAYATGEKTINTYLGVDVNGAPLETILEKAEKAGLATGLVVTTLVEHATPGAFYGHTTDRNRYEDIALDLLRSNIEIAIGGGLTYLTHRADGRNLVDELRAQGYTVAESLAGLEGISGGRAMALYREDDLPYVTEGRDPEYLVNATRKALEVLTTNGGDKGFFLMVEGSRIDHASHVNNAAAMLGETGDFDAAVGAAFDYADSHPGTLVVVVADHETGGLSLLGDEKSMLPESGANLVWSTDGHSAALVPMFAYGTGAHRFSGIVDNTEVNRSMEEALGL